MPGERLGRSGGGIRRTGPKEFSNSSNIGLSLPDSRWQDVLQKRTNMKTNENQDSSSRPGYEAPRLDVISLRGEEVLASPCKNSSMSGEFTTGCTNVGQPDGGNFSDNCREDVTGS
jgi:hypothetical protein